MSKIFKCSRPWVPTRPTALVICCSDGRYHDYIEEYIQEEVPKRPDLFAIPGGTAGFDWYHSTVEESRVAEMAVKLLLKHHDVHKVWLIAHEGCAYYSDRYSYLQPGERVERQLRDLGRAQELVVQWGANIAVHQVYVSIDQDQVVFKDLS